MRSKHQLFLPVAILVFAFLLLEATVAAQGFQYRVTVTNLTKGQVFSPPVVATHSFRMTPLFEVGEPASMEVYSVAEDAVNDPLLALLGGDPNVVDFGVMEGAGGPIMPGQSASIELLAGTALTRVSLISMLITTNDAFFALNSVRGPVLYPFYPPLFGGSETYMPPAYDAGTEANSESCDTIPGPPCGNAGVRDTDEAEGYIYIHGGIHGLADLDSATFDWRNPVAQVVIERVR